MNLTKRRFAIVLNYMGLLVMNICFFFVQGNANAGHLFDAIGIGSLVLTGLTFYFVFARTGFWRLTHTRTSALDERELQVTHGALNLSYSIFSVVCLIIIFTHAVLDRLHTGLNLVITVPLAGSLLYLAHTLPGAILAWREGETPAQAAESMGEI